MQDSMTMAKSKTHHTLRMFFHQQQIPLNKAVNQKGKTNCQLCISNSQMSYLNQSTTNTTISSNKQIECHKKAQYHQLCNKQIQENTLAIETDHLYNSVLTAIQIQEFIVFPLKPLSISLQLWNFQRTLMILCLFNLLLLEIHKRRKQISSKFHINLSVQGSSTFNMPCRNIM